MQRLWPAYLLPNKLPHIDFTPAAWVSMCQSWNMTSFRQSKRPCNVDRHKSGWQEPTIHTCNGNAIDTWTKNVLCSAWCGHANNLPFEQANWTAVHWGQSIADGGAYHWGSWCQYNGETFPHHEKRPAQQGNNQLVSVCLSENKVLTKHNKARNEAQATPGTYPNIHSWSHSQLDVSRDTQKTGLVTCSKNDLICWWSLTMLGENMRKDLWTTTPTPKPLIPLQK